MNKHNPEVDEFLLNGCMRCKLGGTPACKVHQWTTELDYLRRLVLASELEENRKWGMPCYTYQSKNVVMIAAYKESCVLSFLKGSMLKDSAGILELPGENSSVGRVFRFNNLQRILDHEKELLDYIKEAIDLEKRGVKGKTKGVDEYEWPFEFVEALNNDAVLREAFDSLTPGRKKAYVLYFAAAKQPKTRLDRIQKYYDKILAGKGIMD